MAGMTGMEEGGWAAKLFSSALFCLWLSLASVTVWFDAGSSRAPMTAQVPASEDIASRASARSDAAGRGDAPVEEGARASRRGASLPPSHPTPADGAEPDAA